MTKTDWQYGPVEPFWMEDDSPSGDTWAYLFDDGSFSQTVNLLELLDKLSVIDFGCFYEQVYQIRLRQWVKLGGDKY